jgi:hypothetical protein
MTVFSLSSTVLYCGREHQQSPVQQIRGGGQERRPMPRSVAPTHPAFSGSSEWMIVSDILAVDCAVIKDGWWEEEKMKKRAGSVGSEPPTEVVVLVKVRWDFGGGTIN